MVQNRQEVHPGDILTKIPRATTKTKVQEGERVRAGDPLIDGPIDPHDVLSVLGIKELQRA